MDVLDTIVGLARASRTATIYYQKLGQSEASRRTIEPYHLLSNNDAMMLLSWQLDPRVSEPCWRSFRLDRISDVTDGGSVFTPRRPVTICDGEIREFAEVCARRERDPVESYRRCLMKAVADLRLTEGEYTRAENMAERIPRKDLKLVHSQVFASVLFDLTMDAQLSEADDEFISALRGFMERIGWAP